MNIGNGTLIVYVVSQVWLYMEGFHSSIPPCITYSSIYSQLLHLLHVPPLPSPPLAALQCRPNQPTQPAVWAYPAGAITPPYRLIAYLRRPASLKRRSMFVQIMRGAPPPLPLACVNMTNFYQARRPGWSPCYCQILVLFWVLDL